MVLVHNCYLLLSWPPPWKPSAWHALSRQAVWEKTSVRGVVLYDFYASLILWSLKKKKNVFLYVQLQALYLHFLLALCTARIKYHEIMSRGWGYGVLLDSVAAVMEWLVIHNDWEYRPRASHCVFIHPGSCLHARHCYFKCCWESQKDKCGCFPDLWEDVFHHRFQIRLAEQDAGHGHLALDLFYEEGMLRNSTWDFCTP